MRTTTYGTILGGVLEALRIERGVSQAVLAERLGVAQSNISRLENGKMSMSVDMLAKWCTALDVAPSTVLEKTDRMIIEYSGATSGRVVYGLPEAPIRLRKRRSA